MDIEIRKIEPNSTEYYKEVELRKEVLRKPLGIYFTEEQLKEEAYELHWGAYINDKLVGCILLKDVGNGIAKMRQVAVDISLQGKGIGKQMVLFFENFCRENGFSKIEMHARKYAVSFYEKLGYEKYGYEFIEVTIPHYKMRKTL